MVDFSELSGCLVTFRAFSEFTSVSYAYTIR